MVWPKWGRKRVPDKPISPGVKPPISLLRGLHAPAPPLQAPPNPAPLPPGYNHNTYDEYVKHENDFIGLLAYSIYKRQKIAFMDGERKRTGTAAHKAHIDVFCVALNTPEQVKMLREKAESIIGNMLGELLDDSMQKLNTQYEERLKKELKEGASWPKIALQGVVGNTASAAAIALVVILLTVADKGPIAAASSLFDYNITKKPVDTTPAASPPTPAASTPK